jgi:hypothetical protein
MMRRLRNFSFFVLLCIASQGVAQDSEKEKIRLIELQAEVSKNTAIMHQLDSAIYLSDNQRYVEADERFLFVMRNLRSIPSDLTFYFGKNSYHLKKYRQSVDWLNKYIQLKGTTGQYSSEAVEWLKKAEAKLLEEKATESLKAREVLSRDYNIDCGPSGKVTCPICMGKTVIVKKGYFGESYKTCPYCSKHGYLSCDDYNKLVRGQLEPTTDK